MTPRSLDILRKMRDAEDRVNAEGFDHYSFSEDVCDEDCPCEALALCYEKGRGYLGNERINARTFYALLWACAISHEPYSAGPEEGLERYTINETGREILKAHGL